MRAFMLLTLLALAACASPQCFVARVRESADNEPILVGRLMPCDHIKVIEQ